MLCRWCLAKELGRPGERGCAKAPVAAREYQSMTNRSLGPYSPNHQGTYLSYTRGLGPEYVSALQPSL